MPGARGRSHPGEICDNSNAMSRLLIAALVAGLMAQAQIPAVDSRNANTPNTDTHFVPRTYKTLAEWEARKKALRTQILSAAGLLPLFPKNDLHPEIFGRIQNRDCIIEKVLMRSQASMYSVSPLMPPRIRAIFAHFV